MDILRTVATAVGIPVPVYLETDMSPDECDFQVRLAERGEGGSETIGGHARDGRMVIFIPSGRKNLLRTEFRLRAARSDGVTKIYGWSGIDPLVWLGIGAVACLGLWGILADQEVAVPLMAMAAATFALFRLSHIKDHPTLLAFLRSRLQAQEP